MFVYWCVDQSHFCFLALSSETEGGQNQVVLGALIAMCSSDGKSVHLNAVKALKEGMGIGGALLSVLQWQCEQRGVERIWLFCMSEVKGFYEKFGFTVADMGVFKEHMVDGLLAMEWLSGESLGKGKNTGTLPSGERRESVPVRADACGAPGLSPVGRWA